ncbi:hypothetical protein SAMD00079811_81240 (plasmid) [Scytonema sp. HK-05]|nr:hypothetical protein SAMD00079811_81240 [Scytonema sp. HK-05]
MADINLLSPYKLGEPELPNHIVMAPLSRSLSAYY